MDHFCYYSSFVIVKKFENNTTSMPSHIYQVIKYPNIGYYLFPLNTVFSSYYSIITYIVKGVELLYASEFSSLVSCGPGCSRLGRRQLFVREALLMELLTAVNVPLLNLRNLNPSPQEILLNLF